MAEGPYRVPCRTGTCSLTEAEASFPALKGELSIRPLFHQLEPRVKAHVMVAFLGYALWVTLKHLLVGKRSLPVTQAQDPPPSSFSPAQALDLLAGLHSADIVLPTTDGHEIRLRRITEPSPEQKQLLHRLGFSLPQHFDLARKCSADLKSA